VVKQVAAWLEDRKGHFAVSWSRYLDKWMSTYLPKVLTDRKTNVSKETYNALLKKVIKPAAILQLTQNYLEVKLCSVKFVDARSLCFSTNKWIYEIKLAAIIIKPALH